MPFLALALLVLALLSAPAHAQSPVIGAAGDIACAPDDPNFNGGEGVPDTSTQIGFCRQKQTSDLLVSRDLEAVLALGDNQYPDAELDEFQASYDLSWGRVKSITRPVVGNHEYRTDGDPGGYFDYFNGVGVDDGPAGERGKGYYSFDIGSWHLIALNSQCNRVPGGCAAGSAQEQWLRADLAANRDASCTLAYWHHPQFHSGPNPNDFDWSAFWDALHDADADIVLNGHRHAYERFAPQDPAGNADPEHGLREIIVGTGGHSHADAEGAPKPNSVLRDRTQFGVLLLTLHPGSYDWRFVTEAGSTFDSGSGDCHRAPGGGAQPDGTPPQTTITSGPSGTTSATSASFSLSSSEAGSNFQCRLDGGGWMGCGSPASYGGLAAGAHTFEARAIDPAGNIDPTPASRSWSVERASSPSTGGLLESTVLRPSSYEIAKGSVYRNRGKLRRLYRNDGRRLEIRGAPRRSGGFRSAFEVLTSLDAAEITSLRGLQLDFNGGTSRRRAKFAVQVFNHRARQWVKVFGPRRGRRDRSFEWSASAFADDYLSSQGSFVIRVKATGRRPFRARTDLVRLTVDY